VSSPIFYLFIYPCVASSVNAVTNRVERI
jgi:hypothetical protein